MMDAIEPRLPTADRPEPEWLRPSEVAAVFRVSRQHTYRLIRRGDLAAVWVGGTPRIHRDEIARFVAEGGRRRIRRGPTDGQAVQEQGPRGDPGGWRDRAMEAIARKNFPSLTEALREAGVPEDRAETVGNGIRERRLALGLSQTELGRMVDYSHRAISMLELGQWQDPRVSVG